MGGIAQGDRARREADSGPSRHRTGYWSKPVCRHPGLGSLTELGAFLQALALLGWTIGRNVQIDTRWATSNIAEVRRHAAELAALAPDVILAHGSGPAAAVQQATRTLPIVFP